MATDENAAIKSRIDRIRKLTGRDQGTTEYYEAASLAQSVLHDTVGGSHPLMAALENALKSADWTRAVAAARGLLALYDEGALKSPRLAIAREIEGEILDIAQAQAQAAEISHDTARKQVHLGNRRISCWCFPRGCLATLRSSARYLNNALDLSESEARTLIQAVEDAISFVDRRVQLNST